MGAANAMRIGKATVSYETWLGRHLRLIPADLTHKHDLMRADPFSFLRATYYRWAQVWKDRCGDAARATRVLAVGDLHIENFGTWRDVEGRLVWGINDFDEAHELPFTNDLIRLAVSALLARLNCDARTVMRAILEGYTAALEAGGRPFTLAERHNALREMATARLHEPAKYWDKLRSLPPLGGEPPKSALKALAKLMPAPNLDWKISHRIAGLGSLGRERYVAVTDWHGGGVAREAKALAPSACVWAEDGGTAPIRYQDLLNTAVRSVDPLVRVQKRWIVRRLAPDCSRIELAGLPKERDEFALLRAMGWETANIHLGSSKPAALARDLKKLGRDWLLDAARTMRQAVLDDFKEFSNASHSRPPVAKK